MKTAFAGCRGASAHRGTFVYKSAVRFELRYKVASYQDPEEAKDMDDQDHAFNQWELLGEESVEQNRDGCHGNDHERGVPWQRLVAWVVQDDDALDLGGHQI